MWVLCLRYVYWSRLSCIIIKKILDYVERFDATTCDMVLNVVSSILKIMVLNYLD